MSIPPNQFRRDHPWTRFVLLDSSAGPVKQRNWVTFACDSTGPADESKRTKRVQGWSRLIGWVVYSLLFPGIFILINC